MIDRLARQISFFAPAAVMSAWATVMLHTIASGHISRLLSPLFRNYVFIAAILLFVLSGLYVLLYQPTTEPAPAPAFARTGRLRQLGRWFMLLVPVIAASILSPSALSSTTLANRALAGPGANAAMPTRNATMSENVTNAMTADPNQPVPMEVTDLITVGNSASQLKAFDDRKVKVVGIFLNQGGATKLVRWIMWCCAADAQPVSVNLSGNTTGDWKPQQWVEVTGTAKFPSTLGRVVPQIEVDSIKPSQEPDEPYLSP